MKLMNKFAIPAILVATVMVAGIFAFMPVQQASTVHTSGTITTVNDADIAAILVDTDATIPATLTTIDDFIDTEVADILTATGTDIPASLVIIDDFIDTEVADILTATGTDIPASLVIIDDFIDTEVADILTDTAELMHPFLVETAAVVLNSADATATFTCTAARECIIFDATVHTTAVGNTAAILFIKNVSIDGLSLVGANLAAPTDQNFMLIGSATAKGKPADIAISTTATDNVPASVFMTVGVVQGGTAGAATVGPFTLEGGETMTVLVSNSIAQATTSVVTFYGAMSGDTSPATPTYA